ncbi:uncharacterized protein LOC142765969 [Rhipicephalus microplus]|uniref:uncharacterized protein LOC142765969 n=1 Tax=Rhipicephalus microplus TaxID=6941 RepID=UPI003F6CFA99
MPNGLAEEVDEFAFSNAPTDDLFLKLPEPFQTVPGQSGEPGARTLALLRPALGEPGSPENPGDIIPGPTQLWLASAFYRHLIPKEKLKHKNEFCNDKTICEDNTCCLQQGHTARRCKPLGKRGDDCSPRTLANVYYGNCPCGIGQGYPFRRLRLHASACLHYSSKLFFGQTTVPSHILK